MSAKAKARQVCKQRNKAPEMTTTKFRIGSSYDADPHPKESAARDHLGCKCSLKMLHKTASERDASYVYIAGLTTS